MLLPAPIIAAPIPTIAAQFTSPVKKDVGVSTRDLKEDGFPRSSSAIPERSLSRGIKDEPPSSPSSLFSFHTYQERSSDATPPASILLDTPSRRNNATDVIPRSLTDVYQALREKRRKMSENLT
ncbi:hypothetical protein NLJ89_g4107 [Agrocybe chaxingu]|uniref:Uncharacterized protein n=1 Tax=Agrocybe chaxingu TaxID=84603 RepID=A0A9W8K3Y7_9AGAR|nr:hypothetical protein NLJ89_g4107 [Agrocybe chaxingu]